MLFRSAHAAPGKRVLIWGSGTIGLLTAQFALALGAEVHVIGMDERTLFLARDLGVREIFSEISQLSNGYDAIVDATNSSVVPSQTLSFVEPGGRVVFIGVSGEPSNIDSRSIVLKDVSIVGILSASPGLRGAIEFYSSGKVDPRPIVAATVSLKEAALVLSGRRPEGSGIGPKFHIDPRVN